MIEFADGLEYLRKRVWRDLHLTLSITIVSLKVDVLLHLRTHSRMYCFIAFNRSPCMCSGAGHNAITSRLQLSAHLWVSTLPPTNVTVIF